MPKIEIPAGALEVLMKLLASVVLAAAFGLGTLAHADAKGDDDCAKARKAGRACTLIFDGGDQVEGNRPTASGEQVSGREPLPWTNLIKMRTSFRDRIVRSAENH
jgi:hypothetical protein